MVDGELLQFYKAVDEAIARAADAAEMWVSEGVAKAMNTFNRAVDRANVQP